MQTSPIPPCLDCQPTGPIESFFTLFLAFWLLFFLILLALPRPWADSILEIAFPFLPRRR